MSFDDDEESVEDSQPRELYTIELPSIGTFYATSASADVVHGGNTFLATQISRGQTSLGVVGQVRETVVSLVRTHSVVQALIATGIPPRGATLTIVVLQLRSGETDEIWRGPIIGCATEGAFARLRVPNATDELFAMSLPFATASKTCNHGLYDRGCKADRSAFLIGPTVSSVDGTTVVVSSISGKPDQWARYGEIVRLLDGERRSVLDQVGTTLVIDVPFTALVVGNLLQIAAGCDHVITTCRDKFDNVPNFGAFPDLPKGNPTAPTGLGVVSQE